MKESEWLRFEKSGRVADYLTYCQSDAGKYSEYETCRNMAENYSEDKGCTGKDMGITGNSRYVEEE
ncbi:MAG: hypothetical protein LUD14_10060 [Clostridiales bacterium]|nr:hypothetical protein [Clostridiales bacterium]